MKKSEVECKEVCKEASLKTQNITTKNKDVC